MRFQSIVRADVIGLTAAIALVSVAPAAAHPMPGVSDFYTGMLHPLTTIEFLLPLVGMSLFAGQQDRNAAMLVLGAVPPALLLGARAALVFSIVPSVKPLAFAAMILLGGAVALGRTVPKVVVVTVAVLPAAFIGWANGAEIDAQMSAWRFIGGLMLVTMMLLVYGVGLLARFQAPWVRIAYRVIGSWIAAMGIIAQSLP